MSTGSKKEISPGVWRLRVFIGKRRLNGSPIFLSETLHAPERKPGAGTRLADQALARMTADVASGKVGLGSETVGQLLDLFVDHCESIGRAATTTEKYRQIGEAVLKPELGRIKLSKLTARHLDALYAKLTAKGNKATTVRRVHALIGVALHQAQKWGMVTTNVARLASPPRVEPAQIEAPAVDEVQAVTAEAERDDPTLECLLLLDALTGARRGEMCALRWSDVDMAAGTVTIARSIYEVKGGGWAEKATKTYADRRVALDALGLEALRRHRVACEAEAAGGGLELRPDGFVFSRTCGAEPIRPGVVTKFTTRIAKRAGVSTHLNCLRHFSATQLIISNVATDASFDLVRDHEAIRGLGSSMAAAVA